MSNLAPEHQFLENIKTGEALFQRFAERLKTLGFIVNEEHAIDPATGQIAYMSVSSDSNVNWADAQVVFAEINAANINVGIGSSLRARLWQGVNSGAIKLHDFGFRRAK
jgi:hypothetical protein